MLNKAISEERWFERDLVSAPDSSTVELPVGDFCWPCAVSLECFCLEDKETALETCRKDEARKKDVELIRQGVLRSREQLELERVVVEKQSEVCTRVLRRYKFIYAVPFSKFSGVPLDQVSDMCVAMRTPDYGMLREC